MSYQKIRLLFLLCLITGLKPAEVTGQSNLVKGVVSSAQNNEALPFATVIVKGTDRGVNTDEKGYYEIQASNGNVLVFSFLGYKTEEIPVVSQSRIDVSLKPDEALLDEAIVIGYGTQSREIVTSSISKLDKRALENIPHANIASALQGTVSGVRVQSTSGQPGAAPRVIVRGGTSINNPDGSAPLYSVDGILRNDLNDINPQDIETMQVLKDAAATAIYGARGSNGVVIVTTKSGKKGKTSVSYSYELSSSSLREGYDVVSARDQIYFQRTGVAASGKKLPSILGFLQNSVDFGTGNDLSNKTAYTTQYLSAENEHKLNEGWESMPDPLDPSKTIIFQETDFQDKLFRTATSHNHNVSISGGGDKARFSTSLGYLQNNGVAITTNFKRLSLNLNGDLAISDRLKAFGRIMFSNSTDRRTYNDSFLFGRFPMTPRTTKYRFEDGTLAPGASQNLGNPGYHLNTAIGKNSTDNLTVGLGLNWEIAPGLTFDPQVSLFQRQYDGRSFQKAAFLSGPAQLNSDRNASGEFWKVMQKQADGVFTYYKSIENLHTLEAKLGFSYFERETRSLSAQGRGAASDLIATLNASALPVSVNGSESHQLILGYFTRINYNFDQKYLLSLNARYDGASNLGANHKWGFFPGISLGWNLHKEKFWQIFPENLFHIKLRGSYGVNGNISGLGDYQAQGQYSVGGRYSNEAIVQNTVLANQDLKWEKSSTLNLGADINLFHNRLGILFDVYRRVTDNLLTNMSLPESTGFGGILTNLGSLENKGVEIEISSRLLSPESPVQWDVAFNASKVRNKILTLPHNGVENNRIGGIYTWDPARGDYAWLGGLQEGGRIGELYAYKQLSIYKTDEEAASGPADLIVPGVDKRKYGGDVNWLDLDANGQIDERDRVHVGNIYPVWTGGFTNSLRFKNFDFTVRMDYTTGHTIYNYVRALTTGQFAGFIGLSSDVKRSWQNQGDITDIPRFYWDDSSVQSNIYRGNSNFYEKGDFLSMREITLSYNLPNTVNEKLGISNLRINITGNNVYYFTGFKGLNPEFGGDDSGRYPIPRNIIFGVRITL